METGNSVIDKWNELKAVVSELELQVVKNANGTAAAGVRARKGLRQLKSMAAELVKLTIELDKSKKVDQAAETTDPVAPVDSPT